MISLTTWMVLAAAGGEGGLGTLFPIDLPRRDWVHFKAEGFAEPVCGVVYRLEDTVTNGMALGGVDTGCIDLETSGLLRGARKLLTDSGGMQKEAYFFGVPCVTLRDETEWVETVESGWNTLTGADESAIVAAAPRATPVGERPSFYGDGSAAERIAEIIV